MTEVLSIHSTHPQGRLVKRVVDHLASGGVIIYPTDSTYALACGLGEKAALQRIRRLRQLSDDHDFALVCRDLSELATYARVENAHYRLLRRCTPGPYTFILPATREVPRRLVHPRRRSIGLRVPDHPVTQAILDALGQPFMSTTLQLPGDDFPLQEPDEMKERVGHAVDVIVDAGSGRREMTTVVDLLGPVPIVQRAGLGDPTLFV